MARNRNRLYFYLWKSAGRPRSGQVYEIYKNTRKTYRQTCRSAMNTQERRCLGERDNLCRQNRTRELWNKICLSQGANNQNQNRGISITKLEEYFQIKFKKSASESEYIKDATKLVLGNIN